jgi:hypothetical protein
MACLFEVRIFVHNCGEVLLHPIDTRMIDSPNTDDHRITVFHHSCPLVENIATFSNILNGDFLQEVEITQSHTPKI